MILKDMFNDQRLEAEVVTLLFAKDETRKEDECQKCACS